MSESDIGHTTTNDGKVVDMKTLSKKDTVVSSNVSDRVLKLQKILHAVEDERGFDEKKRSNQSHYCSGVLYLQKSSGKWKKYYCEYVDGHLTYRFDQQAKKASGVIRVTFCDTEVQPKDPNVVTNKYEDVYWAHFEVQSAVHLLKICSPSRLYFFKAESAQCKDDFVNTIRSDLSNTMRKELWADKNLAAKELGPLFREQFILQIQRHEALVRSLAKNNFLEDDLPITSTKKDKSGVLCMEHGSVPCAKLRDYYFVLFDGLLFYYKDSKSTTPTGFMTLKYASVHLDTERLAKGEFVFQVRTPLRTIVCKTKHAVALSEWIACLETSLNSHMKKKITRRSSLSVLEDINKAMSKSSGFQAILTHPVGLEFFKDFLQGFNQSPHDVDLYLALQAFRSESRSAVQMIDQTIRIFNRFINISSPERVRDLPTEIIKTLELKMAEPESLMYEELEAVLTERLARGFNAFKETEEFKIINASMDKNSHNHLRVVDPFDRSTDQYFILKVKGQKKSKEIKFTRNVYTIGRDKSNTLVIEDSRVSRSHARVEHNEMQCEYIDLGSSCGSKLNGKPVLRAKLQQGDVVELGQSVLIFQLRKRKRFPFFSLLSSSSESKQ